MTYPPGDQGAPGSASWPPHPSGYPAYPGYPPYPAYPAYPGAYPPPRARDTNIWAILALISAFSIPPLAIIAGHVGLSQIKRTGDQGRGLAIAGLVLGYVVTVGFTIVLLLVAWLDSTADDVRDYNRDYSYSMSVTSDLDASQHRVPLPLSSV